MRAGARACSACLTCSQCHSQLPQSAGHRAHAAGACMWRAHARYRPRRRTVAVWEGVGWRSPWRRPRRGPLRSTFAWRWPGEHGSKWPRGVIWPPGRLAASGMRRRAFSALCLTASHAPPPHMRALAALLVALVGAGAAAQPSAQPSAGFLGASDIYLSGSVVVAPGWTVRGTPLASANSSAQPGFAACTAACKEDPQCSWFNFRDCSDSDQVRICAIPLAPALESSRVLSPLPRDCRSAPRGKGPPASC